VSAGSGYTAVTSDNAALTLSRREWAPGHHLVALSLVCSVIAWALQSCRNSPTPMLPRSCTSAVGRTFPGTPVGVAGPGPREKSSHVAHRVPVPGQRRSDRYMATWAFSILTPLSESGETKLWRSSLGAHSSGSNPAAPRMARWNSRRTREGSSGVPRIRSSKGRVSEHSDSHGPAAEHHCNACFSSRARPVRLCLLPATCQPCSRGPDRRAAWLVRGNASKYVGVVLISRTGINPCFGLRATRHSYHQALRRS